MLNLWLIFAIIIDLAFTMIIYLLLYVLIANVSKFIRALSKTGNERSISSRTERYRDSSLLIAKSTNLSLRCVTRTNFQPRKNFRSNFWLTLGRYIFFLHILEIGYQQCSIFFSKQQYLFQNREIAFLDYLRRTFHDFFATYISKIFIYFIFEHFIYNL